MRVPVATYRLQLTPSFGFRDAAAIVPYLRDLGVSDVYVSPILAARRGSEHGYDVVDPTTINPHLGGRRGFDELARAVRRHDMGLVVDVVPNHMAIGHENPWWMDLLENGLASTSARIFAVDRDSVARDGLLVPILGAPYAQVLDRGELRLGVTAGGFVVRYFDHVLPVDPATWDRILRVGLGDVGAGAEATELRGIARGASRIAHDDPDARARAIAALKGRFRRARDRFPGLRAHLTRVVRLFNRPGSDLLDDLLARQRYRVAFWRTANAEVNYRRFFDITDLAAVRVEDPWVFDLTHGLLLELAKAGAITGLRIDHVDGLRDPAGYLRRLRERLNGTGAEYVVVEKILGDDEPLRSSWPVAGTTGYEFLNACNGVFVDPGGARALRDAWSAFTGRSEPFDDVLYAAKRRALETLFVSELDALVRRAVDAARADRLGRDIGPAALRAALVELTARLDVYRTYVVDTVADEDRERIDEATARARIALRGEERDALALLRAAFLLERPGEAWREVVLRWQQLSGPAMAKGSEDTALYRFNAFVAANEVGGSPEHPSLGPDRFGSWLVARAGTAGMNASATHDTKRGEDVRARIDVLSETPDAFARAVQRWKRMNRGELDPNDEWLLYQTLVGVWPADGEPGADLTDRVSGFMVKALREGKERSSWLEPDEAYEGRVRDVVARILSSDRFRDDLSRFVERIAWHGALTSLAQTLVKVCAPGVPDVYQGTELWQDALVDPDNRRPVDYEERTVLLKGVDDATPEDLLDGWRDGRVKLAALSRALRARAENIELFRAGATVPVRARGALRDHVLAFARTNGTEWALVVVPRLLANVVRPGRAPIGERVWGATALALPRDAPKEWGEVFTGARVRARATRLRVADALARSPVALLLGPA